MLFELGNVAQQRGDHEAARSFHEQSLALRRALEDKEGIAWCLYSLSRLVRRAGDYAAARAALGDEAFAAAWAEGQAMTREQAIAEALRAPTDPGDETMGVPDASHGP